MCTISKPTEEKYTEILYKKCAAVFKNFYRNSSLLGLRYIADARSSGTERFAWILGLAFSLAACVVLVLPIWERWRYSTVIAQQSITDIPFPAITICPAIKIDARKVLDFLRKYNSEEITSEMNNTWRHLSLVCPNFILSSRNNSQMEDNRAIKTIEEYALKAKHILQSIFMYQHSEGPYSFKPIITEEGMCYTYNSMPGNYIFKNKTFHHQRGYLAVELAPFSERVIQWNPRDGYDKNANESAYPLRITGTSRSASFSLTIRNSTLNEDNICGSRKSKKGFSITVHNPADVARPSQNGWHVQQGVPVDVLLSPKVTSTDDKVRRSYTPKERQCFYPNERLLSFFNQYTQRNCELECLANYTLQLCGCVGYYMPRYMDTHVCTAHHHKCMNIAEWEMHKLESNPQSGSEQIISQYIHKKPEGLSCNCLQSCNYIQYQSHVNVNPKSSRSEFYQVYSSTVFVFFEKYNFFPIKRVELSGVIDFIANCGGLLGLCLGFSMLTFVEIFYWLLVQPCANRQRTTENNDSIESNISKLRSNKKDIFTLSEFY